MLITNCCLDLNISTLNYYIPVKDRLHPVQTVFISHRPNQTLLCQKKISNHETRVATNQCITHGKNARPVLPHKAGENERFDKAD